MRSRILLVIGFWGWLVSGSYAVQFSGGGQSGLDTGSTEFPAVPYVGQAVVITDDSAVGACDSNAGAAVSLCRWNGAAWEKLGDGTLGSGLASTDIDTCAEIAAIVTGETGTCGALVLSVSPTLTTPNLGTPSAVVLTNATGTAASLTAGAATALAANGSNCAAGSAAGGVDASGTVESCVDFVEALGPGSTGMLALTADNSTAGRTITGTANEVSVTNGDGVAGNPTLSLPSAIVLTSKTLIVPNDTSNPGTCSIGMIHFDNDATAGVNLYGCTASNTWTLLGDGGGAGSVATDAIWDAAGDLAVGSGANTAARLAKGTALQVLRVNAGATALEWADNSASSGLTHPQVMARASMGF